MAATLRSAIQAELPKIIAARDCDERYDPIMKDLLRIRPVASAAPAQGARCSPSSMEKYSLSLLEHLHLISEPNLDDNTRMAYEELLKKLLAVPEVKQGKKAYPNDYVSRVLLDNYLILLKITTLYFNLSLSSQITKYLVKLVYSLECWEVYHLLLAIPNFDYFLKLVGFEVQLTSLGHMVRPPLNYLNFNLRQGLQYPYPFPFYNFLYHAVNRDSVLHKMNRVSFQSYIDLRLNKDPPKRRGRPKKKRKEPEKEERVEKAEKIDDEKEEFQKHQKVFIFIHKTLDSIANDAAAHVDDEVEDDAYDTDEAVAMMEEERKHYDGGLFVPSIFQKVLNDYERRGNSQALHQCRLLNSHNKPCMKVFYGKNELQRHQEFVHATRKRSYKCFICQQTGNGNQSYPRHDSLARHIRRKHGITGKENKRAVMMAREDAEKDDKEDVDFILMEDPVKEEKRAGLKFTTFSAKEEEKSSLTGQAQQQSQNVGKSLSLSISQTQNQTQTPSQKHQERPQNFSWLPPPKHYVQGSGYIREDKRPEVYPSNYVPYGTYPPNFVPYYKPEVYYEPMMMKGYPAQYPFVNTVYPYPENPRPELMRGIYPPQDPSREDQSRQQRDQRRESHPHQNQQRDQRRESHPHQIQHRESPGERREYKEGER